MIFGVSGLAAQPVCIFRKIACQRRGIVVFIFIESKFRKILGQRSGIIVSVFLFEKSLFIYDIKTCAD